MAASQTGSDLLALVDAGTAALDRGDRQTAARHFAEASQQSFQKAAACADRDDKLRLARYGQRLLQTVHQLWGEASAPQPPSDPGDGEPLTSECSQTHRGFADVAGLQEVKETLRLRLIYPLRHPEKLDQYGLRAGGGLLLYGPPGTGKTLLARAVAGELDLPFFAVKPSEILSKWHGESEQRLSELFAEARQHREGAVIFVDEIDALGSSRSGAGASEAARRLLTQLLQELDGIGGRHSGLLFLAATNEPWLLDEALLRPGRFDEKCYVPLPDREARRELLRLQLQDCWLADDLDFARFAEVSEGYSGADLMSLCQRAKQIPFREAVLDGTERPVSAADLEMALQSVQPSVSAEMLKRFEE